MKYDFNGDNTSIVICLTAKHLKPKINIGCHMQADVFLAPQIAVVTMRFNIDMVMLLIL